MADDVWSALGKGCLAFSHSHAGKMTGTTFKDAGSLVSSLADGSQAGATKLYFEQLKKDIRPAATKNQADRSRNRNEAAKAKLAVGNMATELGTEPFTWEAAARAATELGYVHGRPRCRARHRREGDCEKRAVVSARHQIETEIRGTHEP